MQFRVYRIIVHKIQGKPRWRATYQTAHRWWYADTPWRATELACQDMTARAVAASRKYYEKCFFVPGPLPIAEAKPVNAESPALGHYSVT